jgi:hypothetical protein
MNWINGLLLLVLVQLGSMSDVFCQTEEVSRVNEFWTGASLKYKLNKKVAFNLDQQVRITNNLNEIRSTFFEFGVKYKFNKHFSTRFQHRYTIRNMERHVNRFSLDGTGKFNIKPANLELSYRLRLQHAMVTFTDEPETFLRNRVQIRYKAFKWMKLFARYESFYQFNDKTRFRRNLYAAGIDLKVNKKLDVSLFYRLDQKINTNNPERRNIIACLVSFEI